VKREAGAVLPVAVQVLVGESGVNGTEEKAPGHGRSSPGKRRLFNQFPIFP
jgi:hypothetical protein